MYDGLRSLGLAHNFSKKYYEDGIDELVYQDVVASLYLTEPKYDQIKKISNNTFVPFTVAGGITSLDQIKKIFDCGADKVAINTGAINNLKILEDASKEFGSQSIVSSIEVNSYFDYSSDRKIRELWTKNGKEKTDKNFIDWIKRQRHTSVMPTQASYVYPDRQVVQNTPSSHELLQSCCECAD